MRRREFLSMMGSAPLLAAPTGGREANCILLVLVGGPSQLDTWDTKPDAPAEVRGPFRPIRTNVPGIEISEIFPKMARHADKFSLVRGVHSDAPPVHDIGHQVMQSGREFPMDEELPHIGCTVSYRLGARAGVPAHVLLPGPIGATGGNMSHGQGAGCLGAEHQPCIIGPETLDEADHLRRRYGLNRFGQSCLRAARLIATGVRFVTVNMYETVFDEPTWDIHGYRPFSMISSYRDSVAPIFDQAYSALLDDLNSSGLLDETMVVAMGEFGRTPRINPSGGRDHWTGCWTALMGGGPLKRGEVIGASDEIGAYPADGPVTPAEILGSISTGMGIEPPHGAGAIP
ncbi:MAG: DUF1501 domain-containing protein, partial [bacterium]|nr:DUF1501 domain-containing protein [bacterium]